MERLADDTIESFMNAIEERLAEGQKNSVFQIFRGKNGCF